VVSAYATWDFGGRAGADDLAGLVYIDGGSLPGALENLTERWTHVAVVDGVLQDCIRDCRCSTRLDCS
jgi:hypothetical protein